jgi:hypothetical protein
MEFLFRPEQRKFCADLCLRATVGGTVGDLKEEGQMKAFPTAAATSVAALMATALLGAAPAQARGGGMHFSPSHAPISTRSVSSSNTRSFVKINKTNTTLRRASVHHEPRIKHVTKINKSVLKTVSPSRNGLASRSGLGTGKLTLAKLPHFKASAGNAKLVGRLSVPTGLKPKLTLAHVPNANFKLRLAPFVQRQWKKAFFWVAIAGVGYLTVPELYYDRFYRCARVEDPDYEECISVLSYAALEEEEIYRVRTPMPRTASYRYTAKVEPTAQARQTCSFEPFVERQWNRSFVWVQIPQTGNVTVPEDYYDQFTSKLGTEPPNYPGACKVLVEAAAADTVTTTSPDLDSTL